MTLTRVVGLYVWEDKASCFRLSEPSNLSLAAFVSWAGKKKCHLSLIRTCIFNTLVYVSLGFCLCPIWEDQPFSIKDLCWVLISIANIFLQFRKPIPRWEIHFSATVPVLHVSRMSLQALIKHIIKIDSQNLWIFFSNSLPNCVFIIIMKIGEVSFLNSVLHMVTDFYWGKKFFSF